MNINQIKYFDWYARHVLVHGYYQIKDEIVWATIQTELVPLKEKIKQCQTKDSVTNEN